MNHPAPQPKAPATIEVAGSELQEQLRRLAAVGRVVISMTPTCRGWRITSVPKPKETTT